MTPLRDALTGSSELRDASATVRIEILTPPYACAGSGTLRIVRALFRDDAIELAATYEGFDRLERRA